MTNDEELSSYINDILILIKKIFSNIKTFKILLKIFFLLIYF